MSHDIEGWFDYALLYSEMVRRARPGGILVEVGSWHGRSFLYLARRAIEANKGLVCVSVDHGLGAPEIKHKMPPEGTVAPILTRNVFQRGFTREVVQMVAPSKLAARLFAPGSLEFVFIDASHDYASVKEDISLWFPLVRAGGVLAGHDYQPHPEGGGHPGVAQAVLERFGECQCLWASSCWMVEV